MVSFFTWKLSRLLRLLLKKTRNIRENLREKISESEYLRICTAGCKFTKEDIKVIKVVYHSYTMYGSTFVDAEDYIV